MRASRLARSAAVSELAGITSVVNVGGFCPGKFMVDDASPRSSCGPNCSGVASTIASVCAPPPDLAKSRNWNAKMPIMRSGPRIVPIRNALVRTCASNSRLKITSVLDMRCLDFTDDVDGCTHLLEEDLLERRLGLLESLESNPLVDQ